MKSAFVFNHDKTNTIVLLHGLFTDAGFWLRYLYMFKNYKIVILNIDYREFISKKAIRMSFYRYLLYTEKKEKIIAFIAHSFGTLIPDKLVENLGADIYKICPIGIAERTNSNKFVDDLHCISKEPYEELESILTLSKDLVTIQKDYSQFGFFYIPLHDDYFSYSLAVRKRVYYSGNHFEISGAVKDILSKIKISLI
jgi:hypothetical protein